MNSNLSRLSDNSKWTVIFQSVQVAFYFNSERFVCKYEGRSKSTETEAEFTKIEINNEYNVNLLILYPARC